MSHCMNCHIRMWANLQLHDYQAVNLSPDLLSIVEEWCSREVTEDDLLCQECVDLVLKAGSACKEEVPSCQPTRQVGHECVCIVCGISLNRRSKRRKHTIPPGSLHSEFLQKRIYPRQMPENAFACRACWMQAYNHVREQTRIQAPLVPEEDDMHQENLSPSSPATPSEDSSGSHFWSDSDTDHVPNRTKNVTLQSYSRIPNTANHCFMPDCASKERLRYGYQGA